MVWGDLGKGGKGETEGLGGDSGVAWVVLRKLGAGVLRAAITVEGAQSDRCGRHWRVGEEEVVNEGLGLDPGRARVFGGRPRRPGDHWGEEENVSVGLG